MNRFFVLLTLLVVFCFLTSCVTSSHPTESKTWQKTYGGTGFDGAQCIQQTRDGGYIVCGWTDSFGAGGYDGYLLKPDGSGNLKWQKTCGGDQEDWFNCVRNHYDTA
ncbi:MAG TPA: hypothetical protein PKI14_11425 [Fervidobacterium sp.]|nr:hypothetical protein [Fervidobacterium sp.]HPZ18348.1 hypothetical protein [Fervidobacterium sp.]HQE49624.1 hypothetical protein [Fervidobacterium sp.]HUM43547.1 hypothetical protein [Fervidobacterium sp.]